MSRCFGCQKPRNMPAGPSSGGDHFLGGIPLFYGYIFFLVYEGTTHLYELITVRKPHLKYYRVEDQIPVHESHQPTFNFRYTWILVGSHQTKKLSLSQYVIASRTKATTVPTALVRVDDVRKRPAHSRCSVDSSGHHHYHFITGLAAGQPESLVQ